MRQSFFIFVLMLIVSGLCGQSLSLMTYNIRFDNPADGPDAWPERREFLAAQVRFYAPDVWGIQEGLLHQLVYLAQQLPQYTRLGVGRDDGAEKGEFSALFYRTDRFELLDSGTFWLSPTPERVSKGWDAALPRVCTWALLLDKSNGRRLRVYNTHFDHIGQEARLQSAALIRDHIRAHAADGGPVVLMGDFNSEPADPPIGLLQEALHDARTRSQEPPFGPEGTFNGFKFQEPVTRLIDYIFVSQSLQVLQHAVLSDSRNAHYPSDHLPVLVRLDW